MSEQIGSYFLFLVNLIYFYLLILVLSLFNSLLSQIGIYLLLPALFLVFPNHLNKLLRLSLVIFNGLILDYHCNLPLGFSIFFLIFVHLIVEHKVKFSMFKDFYDHRIILIIVNLTFFLFLFVLCKIDEFISVQWHSFKFFADLILSTVVLLFLLPWHYSIINSLNQKFTDHLNDQSYLGK